VYKRQLEHRFGPETARRLWQIAESAKVEVKRLAAKHSIDAAWRDGVAHVNWTEAGARDTQDYADHLRAVYGADHVEPLDREAAQSLVGSGAYKGGMIDWTAGHIHPLRFALGLARAAARPDRQGAPLVSIFEGTEVTRIAPDAKRSNRWLVEAQDATVTARHVIVATNGYHGGLVTDVARRVMPINNYIVATEPLGSLADGILPKDIAVADSRFVINYFRLSEDRRLLFGGGESYGDRFPADIAAIARAPMLEVFPQLSDVPIAFAWGGTLGITPTRMPYFAELGDGLWTAGGYSGQGVALATLAGRILVETIHGDRTRFDLMGAVQPPAFPGLGLLRRPLLNLAMRWFALRDRFET